MEKIPAKIRIHTRQTLEDGTTHTFTSSHSGFLYQKQTALYLIYQEQGQDESDRIQTTWKLETAQASLIRQGATELRAFFKKGAGDSTTLVTPHGHLPVQFETFRLEQNLSPEGGQLRIGYIMDMAGSVSRMEVEMHVNTDI
ncbi:DUF1934 domain-containing protein [Effusibacillus lacus]|uniref:DUF1934 domain-containing protein n=1 Tax=Effusibacillus lacus TaxID=1348429 RepID=A0A292YI48_9BACL|nr:DUF1934 domain-containing protein [Effusibacillus lacus]GAX89548.1 hypothetical protein EFBL_1172 [Effusibacillus lacus]